MSDSAAFNSGGWNSRVVVKQPLSRTVIEQHQQLLDLSSDVLIHILKKVAQGDSIIRYGKGSHHHRPPGPCVGTLPLWGPALGAQLRVRCRLSLAQTCQRFAALLETAHGSGALLGCG